jgi:hypothetical protein
MSMPGVKEDGVKPWWLPIIFAGIVSAALGFLGESYLNQGTYSHAHSETVDARLQDDALAIAALKIITTNLGEEESRSQARISAVEQTQASIQVLKDAVDALKEQNIGISTQLGTINDILRPARPPNSR